MEKQILTTLFLIFTAFSFILFADLGTGADLFLGGMATLTGGLQLSALEVE